MPKSGSKTFQNFIYCPNHHYIHLQNTSSNSHTWFAFMTLPEMACFCRKRDICRRIDGYFFQRFFNEKGKKNLSRRSAVILFFQEILYHFSKSNRKIGKFGAVSFFYKKFFKDKTTYWVVFLHFSKVFQRGG